MRGLHDTRQPGSVGIEPKCVYMQGNYTHAEWVIESPPGPRTRINGKEYLYFAGTGYLGLQAHPELIAAAQQAVARYGIHSATTRAGFGTSAPVLEVESRACSLLQTESAIYLVSGYACNFALIAAIADQVELAFIDASAHDCLAEAMHGLRCLSRPPTVFRHRDPADLQRLLQEQAHPSSRILVLTDGLFAVSGHVAPLAEYQAVLSPYSQAMLLVDDAHGLAVLGEQGRGTLEHCGIDPQRVNRDLEEPAPVGPRIFHTTTLSKAVGGHGGVIAGSRRFIKRIKESSGWYRGASAPAAPVAAATAKGLELISGQAGLRRQLADNVAALRGGLQSLGLAVESTPSPIVSLVLENASRMEHVHQYLLREGIAIAYARDYAGAGADGILRIAMFATHSVAMIEYLLQKMAEALVAFPSDRVA